MAQRSNLQNKVYSKNSSLSPNSVSSHFPQVKLIAILWLILPWFLNGANKCIYLQSCLSQISGSILYTFVSSLIFPLPHSGTHSVVYTFLILLIGPQCIHLVLHCLDCIQSFAIKYNANGRCQNFEFLIIRQLRNGQFNLHFSYQEQR